MEREKKLVSLCLLILGIACVIIYLVMYQVKGNLLKGTQWKSESLSGSQEVSQFTGQIFELSFDGEDEDTEGALNQGVNNSNITIDGTDASSGDVVVDQPASTDLLSGNQSDPKMLSGTDMYFGVVESIDLLGLSPEYILRDGKSRYFAYFEQEPTALKKTVQQLGGNLYTITTELELIKHQLFGEKISYINLPEYKNQLVVMLAEVKGRYWLLQIPYAIYHQSKSYLQSLFI